MPILVKRGNKTMINKRVETNKRNYLKSFSNTFKGAKNLIFDKLI